MAGPTFAARARQQPRVLRTSHASREVRLLADDVLGFFDATALEVADEIEVSDGRFSIAIVVSGAGSIEGEFGRVPIRRGETFALPGFSLPFRVRAERGVAGSRRPLPRAEHGMTAHRRHCPQEVPDAGFRTDRAGGS